MEPRRPVKYGIGCILVDCILIVEAIVNICTGRMTWVELFTIIVLSIIFAVLLIALIKKNTKKKKDQFNSTKEQERTTENSSDS